MGDEPISMTSAHLFREKQSLQDSLLRNLPSGHSLLPMKRDEDSDGTPTKQDLVDSTSRMFQHGNGGPFHTRLSAMVPVVSHL